jgi:hypothetical protein
MSFWNANVKATVVKTFRIFLVANSTKETFFRGHFPILNLIMLSSLPFDILYFSPTFFACEDSVKVKPNEMSYEKYVKETLNDDNF